MLKQMKMHIQMLEQMEHADVNITHVQCMFSVEYVREYEVQVQGFGHESQDDNIWPEESRN